MPVLIKNARVINGHGESPLESTDLLIKEDRIEKIEPDLAAENECRVIDASGKTVMPGLIDAHIHLMGARGYNPVLIFTESNLLKAVRGAADVQKLIEAGFTAVRCAGSNLGVPLKTAVDEGTIPGPRIVPSNNAISQTGGHGDLHMLPLEWVSGPNTGFRLADGPDECRKAAREQIRAGAGVIKIMTTGGVLSEKDSPLQTQFVDEEIAAMVEEARRVGIKVMSHAQSPEGIKLALRNGVDTIEHGIYLDQECIDLCLEKDAVIVPTFAIVDMIVKFGSAAGIPEYGVRKAEESHKAHLESIQKAHEAGVKIALGTDFLGSPGVAHGDNAVELEILVDQVGFTPMQALMAGTKIGAEALGMENDIGVLEPGKKADLLIVDGNPLDDVTILKEKNRIPMVMKNGAIVVDRN